MKKRSSKSAAAHAAVLILVTILPLAGCGKTGNAGSRTEQEVQSGDTETKQEDMSARTDAEVQTSVEMQAFMEVQVSTEVQDVIDTAQTQGNEKRMEADSIMREYSDTEKEHMSELQQSYRNETAKPEKKIPEVYSAEDVTEGTLCYITSTGEYYLPDRELTDEELLEIIDCSFRLTLGTDTKTQAEWDEIARKERAALEEKVKAADGISEEEAVGIAQKAMGTDLGVSAKGLALTVDETFGWKSQLCVADWSEIKEKDRGALAYQINFNNGKNVADFKDLINYNCVVNAVDGSILEAYSSQGLSGNAVYYGH